jgi:thymidylate synthase (FAD)
MKIIEPSITIEETIDSDSILMRLERFGRTCYKSEDKITLNSAKKFVASLIKNGHESVLEHEKITVKIICDRGVSHELVRHRVGVAFSQESTRYCNYSQDKFGKEITVIKPCFFDEREIEYDIWYTAMLHAEAVYFRLLELGKTPQEARSVLPNSLKTEIVTTMNLRSWIHFLKLRTSEKAHPQMQEVAMMILNEFKQKIEVIFDDIVFA